jgi:tRNA A37 threonylcarbamoyladenosine modification protein TsaB
MQQIKHNCMTNVKKTVFVISIASPILIGIYHNEVLQNIIKNDGKTSDILPKIISEIINDGDINELIYVNGPGSYMSIKLTYIFLKTLSVTLNIPFYAISGFETNGHSPIKALGKKYFFLNEQNEIKMKFLEDGEEPKEFSLPKIINYSICNRDTLPNYQLPAVG